MLLLNSLKKKINYICIYFMCKIILYHYLGISIVSDIILQTMFYSIKGLLNDL